MVCQLRGRAGRACAVAAVTALALAAASPGIARAEKHVVTIENMAFAPSTLTVKRGDTVVWRNKDIVPHTATAAGRFDSGNIAPNKSWTHVMKAPAGRYDYACTYHPGMKASIVVQ